MRLFIIIIFGFFLATGCQEKKSYSTSCPILTGPAGAQLFMSLESARSLCKEQIISVKAIKMDSVPMTGSNRSGDIFTIDAYDSVLLISKASDKYFSPPGGDGINFLMYKGIGKNAYWLGYEEIKGLFYTQDTSETNLKIIGKKENKYRITPEGKHILMSKGMGNNDFFAGDAYGKIYKAVGTDGVEQIGVFDYFIIFPENQPKRWLVMTKGLEDNHWFGELDGVIYTNQ